MRSVQKKRGGAAHSVANRFILIAEGRSSGYGGSAPKDKMLRTF